MRHVKPSADQTTLLIIDDRPIDRALILAYLEPEGYKIHVATDGVEGWERLEESPQDIDVVLLDRNMPRMNGLELLEKMKRDPRLSTVPVIFQTALANRDEVLQGIRAGAYYYLTKPYDPEMLRSIVSAAANDRAHYKELQQEVQQGLSGLALLRHGRFHVQTIQEAHNLGAMLANACPDPSRAVIGLTELLVNAVEHGNLGITYEEKSRLNAEGGWMQEVERRLTLPENLSKRVEVIFEREDQSLRFQIRDAGPGFDWNPYLEIDPKRAFDTHGRGIAMAKRLSFNSIEYLGCGNEVAAMVKCS